MAAAKYNIIAMLAVRLIAQPSLFIRTMVYLASSRPSRRAIRIYVGQGIYQDLPGSIHEDTVMDGHRQGKKQTLI